MPWGCLLSDESPLQAALIAEHKAWGHAEKQEDWKDVEAANDAHDCN